MIALWRRIAALWSALVGRVSRRVSLVRASKNYGRAKRLVWDVLAALAASAVAAHLTELLHGR